MKAWIATDKNSKRAWVYTRKPLRSETNFFARLADGSLFDNCFKLPKSPKVVGLESYPKWENEPVEVELTLKVKK